MLAITLFYLASSVISEKIETIVDTNSENVDFNAHNLTAIIASKQEIKEIETKIKEIEDKGISTSRIKDLLSIAKISLDYAIEYATYTKENPDLSQYRQRMKELKKVIELGLIAKQELEMLEKRIEEAKNENIDTSILEDFYKKAEQEFIDERFERTLEIISQTDQKIVEIATQKARKEAIYEAAASNLVNLIKTYQNEIIIAILLPLLISFIFRQQLKKIQLKARIKSLELEKEILNKEKKKAQSDYFEKGILSESTYKSKMQVYSDMERDITRELALLKEEEKKASKKKGLF
ncbi:MAG: hypothetical protein QXT97_00745 [Candidatus Diapherotrites archaeon]